MLVPDSLFVFLVLDPSLSSSPLLLFYTGDISDPPFSNQPPLYSHIILLHVILLIHILILILFIHILILILILASHYLLILILILILILGLILILYFCLQFCFVFQSFSKTIVSFSEKTIVF